LPNLANNHAAEDPVAFSKALDWGLKLVLVIGLPATLGLVLLAKPLLSTLFQYNEFGASDVEMAGRSLMAFALGLLAFILIKVLVPGFTSRQDIQTPVRFGIYSIVCNVVLNFVFVLPLAHAGVALATTISAYLNAVLLLVVLRKRRIYQPGNHWRVFMLRVVLACAVMSMFLYYFVDESAWSAWGSSQRGLHLVAMIGAAMASYVLVLLFSGFRVRHLTEH
jgi:putative peptidoglycan lipid II flippase